LLQGDTITIVSSLQNCAEQDDISFGADAGVSMIKVDYSNRVMLDISSTPQGSGYKICICPLDQQVVVDGRNACKDRGGFTDSNYLTVQSDVIGISGKGFSGAFTYMQIPNCNGACPAAVAPAAYYQRTKEGSVAQVSVIRTSMLCSDIEDNPSLLKAPVASGWMQVDQSKKITSFEERIHFLGAGEYQMCIKQTTSGVDWKETGIILNLQNKVAALQVNSLVDSDGYIPRSDGSTLRVCKAWDCSQYATQGDAISLVAAGGYCEEQRIQNPAVGNARASGYLTVGAGGGISQVGSSRPP